MKIVEMGSEEYIFYPAPKYLGARGHLLLPKCSPYLRHADVTLRLLLPLPLRQRPVATSD